MCIRTTCPLQFLLLISWIYPFDKPCLRFSVIFLRNVFKPKYVMHTRRNIYKSLQTSSIFMSPFVLSDFLSSGTTLNWLPSFSLADIKILSSLTLPQKYPMKYNLLRRINKQTMHVSGITAQWR